MNHPVIKLLQAAYTAQDAIETMTSIAAVEPALASLGTYAKALMEAAPEHQETLSRIKDDRERGVPTLSELQRLYLAAYVALYTRLHNTQPAAA